MTIGWSFASEPCLSFFPLFLGTVATHCLSFLILVAFLAVTWFLVVWEGWEWHMWCSLVAITFFTPRWEDLYPNSNKFLCVYKRNCSVCVCVLGYWVLCPIGLTLHFLLVPSHGLTHPEKILASLLQIFLFLKSEWRNRAEFCNYGDLFWSFSLLLVCEYLYHRT